MSEMERIRKRSFKRKSVPKTVWMKAETYRELKRLVKEGLFINVSEAMRTGLMMVILLSKLNPETVKMLRELTKELREFNKNMEKMHGGNFYQLWKRNVIVI